MTPVPESASWRTIHGETMGTDWERLRQMTDDEATSNALADPDSLPVIDEDVASGCVQVLSQAPWEWDGSEHHASARPMIRSARLASAVDMEITDEAMAVAVEGGQRAHQRLAMRHPASVLLDDWMADTSGYDEEMWPIVEHALRDEGVLGDATQERFQQTDAPTEHRGDDRGRASTEPGCRGGVPSAAPGSRQEGCEDTEP